MAYNRLIERISLFHKLATYGNRKDFLKVMGQEVAPSLSGPVPPPPGAPKQPTLKELFAPPSQPAPTLENNVQTLPETTIEGETSDEVAIDPEVQKELNALLAPKGLIFPELELDGEIGPLTRKALIAFKSHYNLPATPQNIKEVYLKEQNPGLETKAPF